MYLRSIQRRNLDGSIVRYLQLAHNEWDPATKQARAKVIHSFGREDALDRDAIHRLIKSLTRALDPAQALTLTENAELAFVDSVPWVAPGPSTTSGAGSASAPAWSAC